METADTATPGPARTSRTLSGAQTQLRCGTQSATVVEVGGALRAYPAGGRPLLDGYGAHERCSGARGQTLIPWPNRLRDGSYTFAGTSGQLPLTEPDRRNAIHGLVRWASWAVAERADDGRAWVTLADDASGTTVGLWMDEAYGYHLMLFTGDSLADPGRRRRGLGVESTTCAANALQTGDGLVTPQPGERAVSDWGISPAPPLGEPG